MGRGRREAFSRQLWTVPPIPPQVSTASHGHGSPAHAGSWHAYRGGYEVRAVLRDPLTMFNQLRNATLSFAISASLLAAQVNSGASRVIELTADKDSKYRLGGKVAPTLQASPGEHLILRITAIRAKQVARDGSVHGLALLDKNENVVPGWRFYLHPGVQDVAVTAPIAAGRYTAVCIVICSDMHEDMGFTLVVSEPVAK